MERLERVCTGARSTDAPDPRSTDAPDPRSTDAPNVRQAALVLLYALARIGAMLAPLNFRLAAAAHPR